MSDYFLRRHIRKVISEFIDNSWQYIYGPNKFPKFDGEEKTPDELDIEFDSILNFPDKKMEESDSD